MKTPPAKFAPLDMTSLLPTYSNGELWHRWSDPAFFNIPDHFAPAYRRAAKKVMLCRTKAKAAEKKYIWKSTGRVVVIGPSPASFSF